MSASNIFSHNDKGHTVYIIALINGATKYGSPHRQNHHDEEKRQDAKDDDAKSVHHVLVQYIERVRWLDAQLHCFYTFTRGQLAALVDDRLAAKEIENG